MCRGAGVESIDRRSCRVLFGRQMTMVYRCMKPLSSLHQLSNRSLLDETLRLAACERNATVELIAAIAEVDARRLYLGESCSSMFTYCTRVLHLSEHAAYDRIETARLARRFPMVLEQLASGSLTLTNLRLLAPHLTAGNVETLTKEAADKSKHEVEQLIARVRPQPPVPSTIRKLPERSLPQPPVADDRVRAEPQEAPVLLAAGVPAPSRPAIVRPLAPERYKVQFTVSSETREKLRRVQDLMRHIIPSGDVAAIFDRALSLLLEDLEKRKVGTTKQPRGTRSAAPGSRHIPASVRRQVWKRDSGRCSYVGSHGRCAETGFLEFHHVEPYAAGGRAVVENIELRCRAHNAYEAELFFGESKPSIVREVRSEWFVETGSRTSGGYRLEFAAKGAVLEGTEESVEMPERKDQFLLKGAHSVRLVSKALLERFGRKYDRHHFHVTQVDAADRDPLRMSGHPPLKSR